MQYVNVVMNVGTKFRTIILAWHTLFLVTVFLSLSVSGVGAAKFRIESNDSIIDQGGRKLQVVKSNGRLSR